jgi:hypothetical protein
MALKFGRGDTRLDRTLFDELGDPEVVLAKRALHEARYAPPMAHEKLPDVDTHPLVFRRVVDGVLVRFVEESYAVSVIIEGRLPRDLVAVILDDARRKLSALEGAVYVTSRVE